MIGSNSDLGRVNNFFFLFTPLKGILYFLDILAPSLSAAMSHFNWYRSSRGMFRVIVQWAEQGISILSLDLSLTSCVTIAK